MKKILIIGCGGIGKRHIRGFSQVEDTQISVVEVDPAKREAARGMPEVAQVFASLDEAGLENFTAAVICAPAHFHIPLATACAEAGTPFLLEKPLAVNLDGVEDLLALCRRKQVFARVGYIRRASAETIALRDQLQAGRIGPVRMCYINISQEYPKYRPDYREIYYARRETGGGAILDCASHMIDLLQWTLGEVTEVVALYDHLALEGVEVEDAALISLRYANGAMAQMNVNQFQKPNVGQIEFVGLRGNLLLDTTKGTLAFRRDDSGKDEVVSFLGEKTPMEIHQERFLFQARTFLAGVEGTPCSLTTLEEARDNLRIALAALESDQSKRIISLN